MNRRQAIKLGAVVSFVPIVLESKPLDKDNGTFKFMSKTWNYEVFDTKDSTIFICHRHNERIERTIERGFSTNKQMIFEQMLRNKYSPSISKYLSNIINDKYTVKILS